eukprot:TRINITY_DN157_c0_g1_i2.p1 TRINITY_DN157_c0_g1~~TRINITY_DN157_c0_g1_i2.p1  ORF type:complete len:260 (+),score=31.68 TRINITY_DN157_c0_g1_i2:324-1103(+)
MLSHQGPVWQVAWAHPRFGVILASCSYDRKVIIWKQQNKGQWSPIYTYEGHDLSVNGIEFAPNELGLILACASSDGTISLLSYREGKWDIHKFQAHKMGVNAVSWAPSIPPGALLSANSPTNALVKRFASAGCDNQVKIWRFDDTHGAKEEDSLSEHADWVRDVAWAPSIGATSNILASCSQDGKVIIWTQDGPNEQWRPRILPREEREKDIVWKVSWSVTGNILAVSSGEGLVTLWKESVENEGEWKCISKIDEMSDK